MLHAISMPQLASIPIYVQESFLVSLTPIKFGSCGQPLQQYPVREYELYRSQSDTRCRFKTESGDFRSICGKSPISGGVQTIQAGSIVASSISRTGSPSRTGYTRRQAVHFSASGFAFTSRSPLHAGQTTRSRRSWGIMSRRLYDGQNLFHHRVTETQGKAPGHNKQIRGAF